MTSFEISTQVHGDAKHEVTYANEDNITFSKEQYIKALEKNTSILSIFQSDIESKNILYIGCSLNNELDLEYVINTSSKSTNKFSKRIFVTSREPTRLKKKTLTRLKVDIVLIIKDYIGFYQKIHEISQAIHIESGDEIIDQYKDINIIQYNISDKRGNIDFLSDIEGKLAGENSLPYF